SVAERRVAHGVEVHQAQHRRGVARDRLPHQLPPLFVGGDEIILGVYVVEQLGDGAHDADVVAVEVRVDHHRRIDPRLSLAPGCYRGLAVQHEHAAQTVQVFSWKARSRQAVSAESSTSRGWNGLTPSISRFSGKP